MEILLVLALIYPNLFVLVLLYFIYVLFFKNMDDEEVDTMVFSGSEASSSEDDWDWKMTLLRMLVILFVLIMLGNLYSYLFG